MDASQSDGASAHTALRPLRSEEMSTPLAAPSADDMPVWNLARHRAAVEHVLTKTALSERDRAVYAFYVQERHSIEETAAKFRLARNNVSQIKTRIEKRIAAIGREMAAAADQL